MWVKISYIHGPYCQEHSIKHLYEKSDKTKQIMYFHKYSIDICAKNGIQNHVIHANLNNDDPKLDAVINATNTCIDNKIQKDNLDDQRTKNILKSLLKNTWVDTNYREYKYIIETCSISPKFASEIKKEITNIDFDFLFLVDSSNQQELNSKIKSTQKSFDWTYSLNDIQLEETCQRLVQNSKFLIGECDKYLQEYLDVKNQDLETIKNKVLNFLKENK